MFYSGGGRDHYARVPAHLPVGNMRPAAFLGLLLLALLNLSPAGHAQGPSPLVFWGSDPLSRNDTAMIIGSGLESIVNVRLWRLDDSPTNDTQNASSHTVPALQTSTGGLKFILPEAMPSGVIRYELLDGKGVEAYAGVLNAPTVYWVQGDRGHAASPGGWLRVLGRNIGRRGQTLARISSGAAPAVPLVSSEASMWDARFDIPADLPPGPYSVQIWNGEGDVTSWREAGSLSIDRPASLPQTLVNVAAHGARGNGRDDDTAAFKAALRELESAGGGTLEIPHGYFVLSGQLDIPARVRVKGASRELTRLIWQETETPPPALISGRSDFSLEDLTIVAFNHAHIISGGLDGDAPIAGSGNITIRKVTVRASMYRGHLTPAQTTQRQEIALRLSTGGPDTLRLSGANLIVEDCDLYGSGRSFLLLAVDGAYLARNTFTNGRLGWYSISASDRVIFEKNRIVGGDLQSTGGGINTLGRARAFSLNVLVSDNRFETMNGWDREALTSDGPGGFYFGGVSTADGRVIQLRPQGTPAAPGGIGAGFMIIGGHGMGQTARVQSREGDTLTLDKTLAVSPDATSVVTIVPYQANYIIVGNQMSDTGLAVQIYGSSINQVVADNTSVRTGGFYQHALLYGYAQPSLFVQFLNNIILEGDTSAESKITVWGGSANNAPLVLGSVIRGNRLEGNSSIEIKAGYGDLAAVTGVVVEKNTVADSSIGIAVERAARDVLLRSNTFENVARPIVNSSSSTVELP